MKLRCWANDQINIENYVIPEDSSISEIFAERVKFYRKDVEFHKKQVDGEILTFWRADGLNKDVKKLIVDKYIKRPVRYGCHINPKEEEKRIWKKLFLIFLALIICYCLHHKTMEESKKLWNEIPGPQGLCIHPGGPTGPRGLECKTVCNDNNPPSCDVVCS
jgi:hypothetical protein